jgi:DnaJ-class molecular chaperone
MTSAITVTTSLFTCSRPEQVCPKCNGSGQEFEEACPTCHGKGTENKTVKLEVNSKYYV